MKTLYFKKENGEIKEEEQLFKQLKQSFLSLKNGDYEIVHKLFKKNRSNDQNALMWLWFTCLEDETGQDKQDIHDYYCKLFLRREVVINNKREVVVSGTKNLKTDVMANFLTKVQADAASEFGCQLPTREDLHFEEFRRQYERFNSHNDGR